MAKDDDMVWSTCLNCEREIWQPVAGDDSDYFCARCLGIGKGDCDDCDCD